MTEPDESRTAMHSEEEISLVDLVVVGLRYRRLIIAVPLVMTMLAGIYLYLLPLVGFSAAKQEYEIQVSAVLAPVPADLRTILGVDPTQILDAYFSSIFVQASTFGTYFPKAVKGMSPERLPSFIKDDLLNKRFKYSFDSRLGRYTISFKNDDRAQADLYLSALWSGASDLLVRRMRDGIATSLTLLDKQIVGYQVALQSNPTIWTLLGGATTARDELLALQANAQFPFPTEPEHLVFMSEGRSAGAKTLVLVFFAALFTGIFVAFMANAWARIKEDPEAMTKLRMAWKR